MRSRPAGAGEGAPEPEVIAERLNFVRRVLSIVLVCVIAGFLLQGAVALACWWSAFDGQHGWILDEHDTRSVWAEERNVHEYGGRAARHGWHERTAFVSYAEHRSWLLHYEEVTAWRDEEAYRWSMRDTWPTIGTTRGEPRLLGSQRRLRCGVPFGSLGSTSADERLRADPGSEDLIDVRIFGDISCDVLSREGVMLPRMDGMQFGPRVDRMTFNSFGRGASPMRMPPTRVYVVAMLGNTLVWSVPVFGVLLAWRWLRGWNRRRRGLCTKCKYQLADLTTCPECGTPSIPSTESA